MKNVLLAGTALVGAALIASPAAAEVNLDLGGHFRGYAIYADNDEPAGAAASLREFDFRRDAEIHFSGETTTDNGLTVGVHSEINLGNDQAVFADLNADGDVGDAGESFTAGASYTDETYLYVSGGMGRVNFGSEDGAAYLLQVAAPSADSNVDGMRVYMQALNFLQAPTTTLDTTVLGYDHADFSDTDRLTYLSPKWNGFQAGFSYAPEAGQNAIGNNVAAMANDENNGDYEDLWELAARWDGEFEGFGISLGAGYSTADTEAEAATPAAGVFADDLETWNVGANVAFGAFSVGAVYTETDTTEGDGATVGGLDVQDQSWVVGAAWDNGPYHLGATYLDKDVEVDAANDFEVNRFAVGGGYTYGPGMTFRGAVAFGETDDNTVGTADEDFTQVTVGTDVQF